MTVVDASVVLQWLLEEASARSRPILERHLSGRDPAVAPELLYYEVGNVLATKTRLGADETTELFERLLTLDIETHTLGADEYHASLRLARRHGLSVYDASYLALALAVGAKLVTADRRLAAVAARLGIAERI